MSSRNENIEKIVAKIDGSKIGNAFLIDKNQAVTVKHCIQDLSVRVKLVFPKMQEGEPIEVWATVDEQFNPEEDELLLLNLEQEFRGGYREYTGKSWKRWSHFTAGGMWMVPGTN